MDILLWVMKVLLGALILYPFAASVGMVWAEALGKALRKRGTDE